MAKKKYTKLEINKKVRQVLAAHTVDLNFVSINCSLNTITLSGRLQRSDTNELTPEMIMRIMEDLKHYGRNLVTDLENWDLNNWKVTKLNRQVKTGRASEKGFSSKKGGDIILKIE